MIGHALAVAAAPAAWVRSPGSRFIVHGGTEDERNQTALWADDVLARVERVVRRQVPFQRGEIVDIVFQPPPSEPPSQNVLRSQVRSGRMLYQQLLVFEPAMTDPEELLENLCMLLLHRIRVYDARQPGAGDVPQWAAIGLAQSLYAPLRARAVAWVSAADPALFDLAAPGRLLGLEQLPPGRNEDRDLLCLFAAWLGSGRRQNLFWPGFFQRLAAGRATDTEWLAELLQYDSTAELAQAWELWLMSRRRLRAVGSITPADMEALRSLDSVAPEILSLASGRPVTVSMTAGKLIEEHKEPWMPALGAYMTWKTRSMAIGTPPAYQAPLEAYALFYQALGSPGGRRHEEHLRQLLHAARSSAAQIRNAVEHPTP